MTSDDVYNVAEMESLPGSVSRWHRSPYQHGLKSLPSENPIRVSSERMTVTGCGVLTHENTQKEKRT